MPKEIKSEELDEKYFNPKLVNTLEDIFERMIFSAQNYQRMPNVINFEKIKDKVKVLLFNYNIHTAIIIAISSVLVYFFLHQPYCHF